MPGPKGSAKYRKAANLLEETNATHPMLALISLREGTATCTLCKGREKIALEKAIAHKGRFHTMASEDDHPNKLVPCTLCYGTGHMVLDAMEIARVEASMLPYLMPKLSAIKIEEGEKKRPTLRNFSHLRDPQALIEALEYQNAINRGLTDGEEGDDSE